MEFFVVLAILYEQEQKESSCGWNKKIKSRVNHVSRMKRQSKGHIFLSNSDIEAKYSVESTRRLATC